MLQGSRPGCRVSLLPLWGGRLQRWSSEIPPQEARWVSCSRWELSSARCRAGAGERPLGLAQPLGSLGERGVSLGLVLIGRRLAVCAQGHAQDWGA